MIRSLLIVLLIVFYSFDAVSQKNHILNNYFENPEIFNPSFTGSKAYNPLVIKIRKQWLGFEDAPYTGYVSYGGAFNNRSAIGFYLLHDVTFPSQQSDFQLNYAYHIPLNNKEFNLSFGIGAKLIYYRLKFDISDLPPGNDPAFSLNLLESFAGDASAGALFYSENFYLSYSTSNMLQNSVNTDNGKGFKTNNLYRNHHFNVGFKFNIIDNDWHLHPSLFATNNINGTTYNINTRVHHLNDKWIGINYNTDDLIALSFGVDVNDIFISYCYEHSFNGNIMLHNFGTHQIGIIFKLVSELSERHISFWQY